MHKAQTHSRFGNQSNNTPSLESLGFGTFFEAEEPEDNPLLGRVLSRQATRYSIATRAGILQAEISGRLSYLSGDESELPAVGDWVLAIWDGCSAKSTMRHDPGVGLILEVLPRASVLSRKQSGEATGPQVMAANVDTMIIVWSMDKLDIQEHQEQTSNGAGYVNAPAGTPELRPRWGAIQRFLNLAEAGNIKPVLVFSKADLFSLELQEQVHRKATDMWPQVPILVLSVLEPQDKTSQETVATDGIGSNMEKRVHAGPYSLHRVEAILDYIPYSSTSILVGASGAGKSSLVNALRTDRDLIRTGSVREDDKRGRHTTTHRELYALPNGGLVIDSPGIREIGLWGNETALRGGFELLTDIAAECRFADCGHGEEPGCAVRTAIRNGVLDPVVLEQYRKQQSELAHLAARQIRSSKQGYTDKEKYEAGADERRWKSIHKSMRTFSKEGRSLT